MNTKRRSPIWKISKEELENIINNSDTMSEVLLGFGLANIGGNYKTLKNRCVFEQIDLEPLYERSKIHRTNKSSETLRKNISIPLENLLVEDSSSSRSTLRRRIILLELIEYKCAICGLLPEWNNESLSLVLDHINGINNDDRLENLRFLCPNCNSQTITFAGRNNKSVYEKAKHYCDNCGEQKVTNRSSLCVKCADIKKRKIIRPNKEELGILMESMNYCEIGRKLGVSDVTIGGWARGYGLR